MFLPHIAARPAADPLPVASPITSPITIQIQRDCRPAVDRGASLDVKQGSCWFPYSYHANAETALEAFNAFGWTVRQSPERWRVLCHRLDVGSLDAVAREPERAAWETV